MFYYLRRISWANIKNGFFVVIAIKMMKRYPKRTNIYLIDEDLWAWAQYRSKILGYRSVSTYIFELIKLDKERELMSKVGNRTIGQSRRRIKKAKRG